jgi:predicted polyphosphate/ATP-dependent NAD kinase
MPVRSGKIGLIVNPIAGMGGRVGLKGTDGAEVLARAKSLGAEPLSSPRARLALTSLRAVLDNPNILTVSGEMGEQDARFAGLEPTVSTYVDHQDPTARDTQTAAAVFEEQGVGLILFAGGDGTARDIHGIVGDRVPILGIPTGVKMHSAVFARGPAAAGRLAARYISGQQTDISLRLAEVMDLDEGAEREARLSSQLHGYALTPYERTLMQHAKAANKPSRESRLRGLAAEIVAEMKPGWAYVLGPGTTTHLVLDHLGIKGTLLGVDVLLDGEIVVRDANEADLLALPEALPTTIILGVVGGQGFILGRGNQQISALVIKRVGAENVEVIASIEKLISLEGRGLLIDSGDAEVDARFGGYLGVRTALGNITMTKVTPV